MKKAVIILVMVSVSFATWGQVIDVVPRQTMVGTFNRGIMTATTVSSWEVFLDGKRITERVFYELAGDQEAHRTVVRRRAWGTGLLLGGTALLAAGFTGSMLFYNQENYDAGNIFGCFTIPPGLIASLASLGFWGNVRPYPYAQRLAEQFNALR